MKSHVEAMLRVYDALFQDIIYAFPQSEKTLSMDLAHLRRTALARGVRTLVVDLPLIGKHLDRCLSKGSWSSCSLTLCAKWKGKELPIFMGGLFQEIFRDDGSLKEDYSVEALIFLRQVFYLCKKVPLSFSETALRASVQKMVAEDMCLPMPELFWFSDTPSTCMARVTYCGFRHSKYLNNKFSGKGLISPMSVFLRNLDLVSRRLNAALGNYSPKDWRFKHGPGAISQVAGPTNKYYWYGWSDRLESVYPVADYGFHNHSSWAGSTLAVGMHDNYVPFSRLVAVPKTFETPRLIAAEPSEHQFCQQNIWHYFRDRTANSWIGLFVRFTDQTLNQDLCLEGSKTGTLCTLDLKSASDRMSCHVVGNFFRSNLGLLDALRATRTHVMEQGLDQTLPRRLELKKFSTMGSACTFPVQSVVFLGIALAAVLTNRMLTPSLKNINALVGSVAVFGDDIIVPSDCRELVQAALELLDFKVNESKSFSEGFFRESCGVDAFRGVDVTPVYLRSLVPENPESICSVVDSANNFYSLFYLHVAAYLESILPSSLMTVHIGSGHLGLHSRTGTRFPRKRWNAQLQREEVRGLALSSTVKTVDQEDDSSLHQYFTEDPSPHEKWEAGLRKSPHLKMKMGWVDIAECI